MTKITKEIIGNYNARQINREDIARMTGMCPADVDKRLRKLKTKIWDLKFAIRFSTEEVDKITGFYQRKEMNREQICREYDISRENITAALNRRKIPLWDDILKAKRDKKKRASKFFSWADYKHDLMCNYNNTWW